MEQTVAISDDALKLMVAEHGVRGTARLLGMDETQTNTFRKKVFRGGWMSDPAIVQLREKSNVSTSGRPAFPVVSRMSPAQANAAELQRLGQQTRLSLAKGISKASAFVEELSGREIVDASTDVKNIAQTADLVHGWKDSTPNVKIRLDVLNAPAEVQIADVEAEVIEDLSDSDSWDNELDSY